MSTFICEECGCIDNTSMNNSYWSRNGKDMYNDNRALCQQHSPTHYADGTPCTDKIWGPRGKWHNEFPKTHWSEYLDITKILDKDSIKHGNLVNAVDYFNKVRNGIIHDEIALEQIELHPELFKD